MKKCNVRSLVLAAVAGCACSAAMAQGQPPSENAFPLHDGGVLRPAYIEYKGVRYPVGGGHTDTNQFIYENGASPFPGALAYFTGASLPNWHELDQVSFNPGPGQGAGRLINGMIMNVAMRATVTTPTAGVDVLVSFWDTLNTAATPVTQNQIGGTLRIGFNAPAAGWAANTLYSSGLLDFSTLPGGGFQTADDQIYVDQAYVTTGGASPANPHPDATSAFYSSTGPGQTAGSSVATYWRDANGNGQFDPGEERQFAAPLEATFMLALQADVATLVTGACCKPDGTCADAQTQTACTALGGTYRGDNSLCSGQSCPQPPTGACCKQDGSCVVENRFVCATDGGRYKGDGVACGACPTAYNYTGQPVAIEDGPAAGGCGTTAIAQIVVPDNFILTSADIGIFVSHTYQGDLEMTLRHVDTGTNVKFVNHPAGGSGTYSTDDYGTAALLFRSVDTAINLYDSPPLAGGIASVAGSWKPANPLTAFIGENAQGTWNLEVADCANIDTGTINAVRLFLGRPVVSCYANCDGSTTVPCLNVLDFGCFLNKFAAGDSYANCDGSTTVPVLNVLDFGCFLNRFAAGCSSC